ncbi:MAG: Fe-S protein [Ilumatobacter sp.]
MPSVRAAADNLKGYCYFLDADVVGICEMPSEAWTHEPIDAHTHAIVILVGHRRPVDEGEPGFDWIAGAEQTASDVRAMEIATVVGRYLGTLGHAATAHTYAISDVDVERVALEAGVVEARNGTLTNPLIRAGYGLAVITTSCADLPVDQPLAVRSTLEAARIRAVRAVGFGGTRPGLRRLDGQNRPWHLGRYPMEKLDRVDEPTTLIIDDEVQRVPARHNFFVRARAGDLGDRPKAEVARFIPKAPHGMASGQMLGQLVPLQDGPVADTVAPGTDDPDTNARALKALGHFLGADMTGVCRAPEYAWYSHRPDGTEIDPEHDNAIVFVLDQGFETMEGASGDDWISGAQSMRAYLRASLIACTMAAHIRALGWEARAHTAALDDVTHIPLLLAAGIGELSRIGELVLNPFVGPRFKSGVVTTNMPITSDKPIDFGLQDFCGSCTKCARECPCGAIRSEGTVMFNGYEMWKPDVDRCARYRITNMRGSACGRCMKACPYNTEGVMAERPFQWAAIKLPWTRRHLATLDDRLARGSINPIKKWWVDIEMIDGTPVEPPKGSNARQLDLEKKTRDTAGFAMFPPDMAPPGADGMTPFPLDRRAGVEASRSAEHPADARRRR